MGGQIKGSKDIFVSQKGRGSIKTDLKEIKWNKLKIFLVSLAIGLPYLGIVIGAYLAGVKILSYIMIGLGILVLLILALLRWIEKAL